MKNYWKTLALRESIDLHENKKHIKTTYEYPVFANRLATAATTQDQNRGEDELCGRHGAIVAVCEIQHVIDSQART